jgi:hypothetical protein
VLRARYDLATAVAGPGLKEFLQARNGHKKCDQVGVLGAIG